MNLHQNKNYVVFMKLSQVKLLQIYWFKVPNQNAICRWVKLFNFLLFPVIFGFWSKRGKNYSWKVHFDIPPVQALNMLPLMWEVDCLPTWAEVYDINCIGLLLCFIDTSALQHFTRIHHILMKWEWHNPVLCECCCVYMKNFLGL